MKKMHFVNMIFLLGLQLFTFPFDGAIKIGHLRSRVAPKAGEMDAQKLGENLKTIAFWASFFRLPNGVFWGYLAIIEIPRFCFELELVVWI